jgi:hypothetical protein
MTTTWLDVPPAAKRSLAGTAAARGLVALLLLCATFGAYRTIPITVGVGAGPNSAAATLTTGPLPFNVSSEMSNASAVFTSTMRIKSVARNARLNTIRISVIAENPLTPEIKLKSFSTALSVGSGADAGPKTPPAAPAIMAAWSSLRDVDDGVSMQRASATNTSEPTVAEASRGVPLVLTAVNVAGLVVWTMATHKNRRKTTTIIVDKTEVITDDLVVAVRGDDR